MASRADVHDDRRSDVETRTSQRRETPALSARRAHVVSVRAAVRRYVSGVHHGPRWPRGRRSGGAHGGPAAGDRTLARWPLAGRLRDCAYNTLVRPPQGGPVSLVVSAFLVRRSAPREGGRRTSRRSIDEAHFVYRVVGRDVGGWAGCAAELLGSAAAGRSAAGAWNRDAEPGS